MEQQNLKIFPLLKEEYYTKNKVQYTLYVCPKELNYIGGYPS